MNPRYRGIAAVLAGVLGAAIGVSSPAQASELSDLRWDIGSGQDEISDFAEDNGPDQEALALELAELADQQDERDLVIAELRESDSGDPVTTVPTDGEPAVVESETVGAEPETVGAAEQLSAGDEPSEVIQPEEAEQTSEQVSEEQASSTQSESEQSDEESDEPEAHPDTALSLPAADSGSRVASDGVFAPAEPRRVLFLNNPLSYMYVTSNYGMRYHPTLHYTRMHSGTDLRAPCGTSVIAAQSGIVLSAKWNGTGGNTIMIDHGTNGEHNIKTRYLHLSKMLAKPGQIVSIGDQIGLSGMTGGVSTGCHLHFEVLLDDETVDPLTQLPYELPAPLTVSGAPGTDVPLD